MGGGGTDMGEGIAQAVALRARPSVVVVLTDGWTPWPQTPPPRTKVVAGLIGPEGRNQRTRTDPATAAGVGAQRAHRHSLRK